MTIRNVGRERLQDDGEEVLSQRCVMPRWEGLDEARYAEIQEELERVIKEKDIAEKKCREIQERVGHLENLSSSVAHELCTPLTALTMSVENVFKFLPTLMEAYEQATSHKLIEDSLDDNKIDYLKGWSSQINMLVDSVQMSLNLFLSNLYHHRIDSSDFEISSINESIELAIEGYPFASAERRASVHWQKGKSFDYYGDNILTQHIIWNLLKNAMYYIGILNQGEVTIWVEQEKDTNSLHFKDTAGGMSDNVKKKIFDDFYSERASRVGLGLSFCKSVMAAYNGNIVCHSREGKFAHFVMTFPFPSADNRAKEKKLFS